jgi:hypothetical protein
MINWPTTILLFAVMLQSSAYAQTAIVTGDCVLVNQELQIGDGSVVNQELDCFPPDPNDAFRVRYIWLDEVGTSLLLEGRLTDELKTLFGPSPIIARNEVYDELNYVHTNFSIALGRGNLPAFSQFQQTQIGGTTTGSNGQELDHQAAALEQVLHSTSDRVNIISLTGPFFWPNIRTIENLFEYDQSRSELMSTYASRYRFPDLTIRDFILKREEGNEIELHGLALECAIYYEFIDEQKNRSYWSDMHEARSYILNNGEYSDYIVQPDVGIDGALAQSNQNRIYSAMGYFAREGWPNDFLLRSYSYSRNGCVASYGVGTSVLPRRFYTKFAVFQSKSGEFDLRHFEYGMDPHTKLRSALFTKDAPSRSFQLGEIARSPGESVIVPIAVELRYDLWEAPFNFIQDNPWSSEIHRQIEQIEGEQIVLRDGSGNTVVSRQKSSFRPPDHRSIVGTYFYGPAIEIRSIGVGGSFVPVRSAPAVATVMRIDTLSEEGSCPFLYFRMSNGEIVRAGRVLVGASDRSLTREERIEIPNGAISVIIQEEEPEITFLDQVAVAYGRSTPTVKLENARIDPGGAIEFDLVDNTSVVNMKTFNQRDRQLIIRGFYKTLY